MPSESYSVSVHSSATHGVSLPSPSRARRRTLTVMRAIFLIHRYLGIGLGVLMALWCLSGIVMIYVPFPQLLESERLAALPTLNWSRCCRLDGPDSLPDDAKIASFQLEILGDAPVLRLSLAGGNTRLVNPSDGRALAANGRTLNGVDQHEARIAAAQFGASRGLSMRSAQYALIDHDQWTVGGFRTDRPLHWIAFNDADGTEIYVSSRTGKVVQLTTRSQRFWSWIGAVPHWLYPSILRKHPEAWSQVVIWTSLLGSFLTVTGLYIGIRQLKRRRRDGALASPYRGIMFWHHVPGLIFGTFALTWVVSGLLSMNPWGLLESQGFHEDRANLTGPEATVADVRRLLDAVPRNSPTGVVSVRSATFDGRLFAISSSLDGSRRRFDITGASAEFANGDFETAAKRLVGTAPSSWTMLTSDDTYHYSIGRAYAQLLVLRISAGKSSPTYYYVDAITGELVDKADSGSRAYRWWHSGLHRLDFAACLRTWTARTLLMLPLLIGAAFVCGTGAYLGIRRLTR